MRKAGVLLCICIVIITFSNCNKQVALHKSPAKEMMYARHHFTDAQRAEGKAIFESACGECHDLPIPNTYTVHELDDLLPKMFIKSKLSYDSAGLVKAYMVYNAKGI